jgi:hypothetical protein
MLLASLGGLAPASPFAQPTPRPRVMGILGVGRVADNASDPMRAFVTTLAELGWVEGKTITILRRATSRATTPFQATRVSSSASAST